MVRQLFCCYLCLFAVKCFQSGVTYLSYATLKLDDYVTLLKYATYIHSDPLPCYYRDVVSVSYYNPWSIIIIIIIIKPCNVNVSICCR